MANSIGGNPKVFDTAGATSEITSPLRCQSIQWIDDNADIADNHDLVFVVNGQSVTIKYQKTTDVGSAGVVYYEANFPLGLSVGSFSITTIDAGAVVLWCV